MTAPDKAAARRDEDNSPRDFVAHTSMIHGALGIHAARPATTARSSGWTAQQKSPPVGKRMGLPCSGTGSGM